jgi:hypothetical protein
VDAPNPSESITTLRARVAGLTRRNASAARITDAKRELKNAVLQAAIDEAVSTAPPLSASQRERLALLLCPGQVADA